MIYGRSYEGRTRACEKCGHATNVHMPCANCERSICENCAYVAAGQHYCDQHCYQEATGMPDRRSAGSEGRPPFQSKQKEG